jgi:hypothetical protein
MNADDTPRHLRGAPCKAGDPIRLINMGADDPDPIPPGTTGIVESVCPVIETWSISVNWDSARSLSLAYPADSFVVLPYPAPASLLKLTLDQLTATLEQFCAHQNLPHEDAAELRVREDLMPEQRDWIEAFCNAWENTENDT